MKNNKFASIYALIVGVGMIGLWVMLISTGQVEEFETIPYEITFHLAGEFMTALLLIAAAILTFSKSKRGKSLLNVAFGALLYTVIVSSGYYMQRAEIPMIIMFAVLFILTIVSLVLLNKKAVEK